MLFVDVILPLALSDLYTYSVPENLESEVKVGQRVIVQFGRTRYYTAVIGKVHSDEPPKYQTKEFEEIVDVVPIVLEHQLHLWRWIADYYQCHIGEVMNAALPNALKLVSESVVVSTESDVDFDSLSNEEYLVMEALELHSKVSLKNLSKILAGVKVFPVVDSLLQKELVFLQEELKDKVKPLTKSYLLINIERIACFEDFDQLIHLESAAPKQRLLLQKIKEKVTSQKELQSFKVDKKLFKEEFEISDAVLKAVIEKGYLIESIEEVGRINQAGKVVQIIPILSEQQQEAFQTIKNGFANDQVTLLHGVTGSGKTEIYFNLIAETLKQRKQVLYLLPEIALTTQLVERLQVVFGGQVAVYHSRFNIQERAEIWKGLLNEDSKYKIVIGARSCVFLPFKDLGLVIVDEEHESSFKQIDPAPRYHARDVAIYLAKIYQANCVLGTATPSVESYYNVNQSKFAYAHLTQRYLGVQMPEIFCADLSEDYRKKKMKGIFSEFLFASIEEALKKEEQIILFQNRRGFSPVMECRSCGNTEKCDRCDVSYTFHKSQNILKCHYCGQKKTLELNCSSCGSLDIGFKGFGTEKIQEEVKKYFPTARVKRMDLETTRGKHAYQELIEEFASRKVDVLVGTQMLTKGLDFEHVSLVGVLNADQMLHYPDFRAYEKAYQLLTQVSGRAGRRGKRGRVVIQSYSPYNSVIRQVIDQDYKGLFDSEILHRKNFNYPPFYRLINITFKHRQKVVVDECAQGFALALRSELGEERILGPEYPVVMKINKIYHKELLIKFERSISPNSIKKVINKWIAIYQNEPGFKTIKIQSDVDPV